VSACTVKFQLFPNPDIITFDNVVSMLISIIQQLVPLIPPQFTPNLITIYYNLITIVLFTTTPYVSNKHRKFSCTPCRLKLLNSLMSVMSLIYYVMPSSMAQK